jgi:hypothetical protein
MVDVRVVLIFVKLGLDGLALLKALAHKLARGLEQFQMFGFRDYAAHAAISPR